MLVDMPKTSLQPMGGQQCQKKVKEKESEKVMNFSSCYRKGRKLLGGNILVNFKYHIKILDLFARETRNSNS